MNNLSDRVLPLAHFCFLELHFDRICNWLLSAILSAAFLGLLMWQQRCMSVDCAVMLTVSLVSVDSTESQGMLQVLTSACDCHCLCEGNFLGPLRTP